MIIYAFLVLAGQSIGTLLGRIYFVNGGQSEWLATLVQVVGFPILFPFLWVTTAKKPQTETNNTKKPSNPLTLITFYIAIGIFAAGVSMLYSVGLQYLPVTTFTLICASQLAFNAIFSYFLNKQKFTPYIVNSLVLLTISSVLLVFQTDPGDGSNKTSRRKYVIGFLSSASHALMLSLTQVAFQKIIKKETIRSTIDLTIYQSLIATFVILIGLFASGDWETLGREMKGYKLGQVSYVMNLFWAAVSWQALTIGSVGLIFKVSSLFSNVINILGLSMPPVLAVVFLNDKLTGLKAVAMVLAMWGIVSYMYQHYLNDSKIHEKTGSHNQQAALVA
ncbi:probable purine permease 9 [Phtheirospermum japonicum]|uniref:Probable purine permease n=1 Tax=Phtheirospermum japonicum TaxID=374723 RepID=A0A830C7I6_9LAMI|nr:probable purine permease 9 [Phtheirospermum japonicum]